jgi:hypothetical protein
MLEKQIKTLNRQKNEGFNVFWPQKQQKEPYPDVKKQLYEPKNITDLPEKNTYGPRNKVDSPRYQKDKPLLRPFPGE